MLTTSIWNPLPPKPTTCYACGGYLRNNKIYIIGGRDGQTPVQNVQVLDLETQQLENLAPMPSIRVFYSVMGFRDEIFSLGGLVPMVEICEITEKYSIKENKWMRLKDMLDIRSDATHGSIGGRLVVAGGLGEAAAAGYEFGGVYFSPGEAISQTPESLEAAVLHKHAGV